MIKGVLALSSVLTTFGSAMAWYISAHPLAYLGFGIVVDPKHLELLALGFLGCALVSLVGVGVLLLLERLVALTEARGPEEARRLEEPY